MKDASLLEVEKLHTWFPVRKGVLMRTAGHVRAVDDVSLTIRDGETLGLVGESGSGKSTLGKSILRLVEPTSGKIKVRGTEITGLSQKEMFAIRREVQMVFQDPYSSLNPRIRVGQIIAEGVEAHGIAKGRAADELVEQTFAKVGLSRAQTRRYANEFSGGQRQRIGIARALALSPGLIIADEPVSALDVSVQAQVINLFMDLQQDLGLAYLFIAHDLSIVSHMCHRIAVMYLGHIVEIADRTSLFSNPQHPYTEGLMAAIPIPDPSVRRSRRRTAPDGEIPNPRNPPTGCPFHPRCSLATDICRQEMPALSAISGDHAVACHHRPDFGG